MLKNYHQSFNLTESGDFLNLLLKKHGKNVILSNTPNIRKLLNLAGLYFYYDYTVDRPKINISFENTKRHVNLSKLFSYIYNYSGNICTDTIRDFLEDKSSLDIDHLDGDKLNNCKYNLMKMRKELNNSKRDLPLKFKFRFALTLCNDGQRCRAELLYLTGFDRLYSAKFFFDSPDDLVSCLKWLVRNRGRWKLRSRRYGVKVTDRTQYTTDYSLWSGCRIVPLVPMYERQKALAELPLTGFERWSKNAIE